LGRPLVQEQRIDVPLDVEQLVLIAGQRVGGGLDHGLDLAGIQRLDGADVAAASPVLGGLAIAAEDAFDQADGIPDGRLALAGDKVPPLLLTGSRPDVAEVAQRVGAVAGPRKPVDTGR
jgi:hypothetical protein